MADLFYFQQMPLGIQPVNIKFVRFDELVLLTFYLLIQLTLHDQYAGRLVLQMRAGT